MESSRWALANIRERRPALFRELEVTDVLPAAVLVAQLVLVLSVVWLFQIEESFGFVRLIPVLLVGFVLHAALPARHRLRFFVVLSFVAIGWIFGLGLGAFLIGAGLLLIGLCHLPVAFPLRVALLLLAAGGLAALRLGAGEGLVGLSLSSSPALATIVLPILASMFMFRLIVYLYDLRHGEAGASLSERLSYFFLLPNVCFPLFPVVDFQVFRRTYYGRPALEIYQKGLSWMLRGIVHLLLYRAVYHYLLPVPSEVGSLATVAQHVVTTYLLYLRISGQFHLIVGILCLFGFDLPETHRLYYLASSFNDFWRRINIYWKDFMKKVFYYPAFMWLKRRGWRTDTSLGVATLFVFLSTWLLHSYQWFWLKGAFPVRGVDAAFWGVLGLLVVANSLSELRTGRRRKAADGADATWRDALRRAARTTAMFVFISLLWSLWSSPSVAEWASLMAEARNATLAEVGLVGGVLLLLVLGGAAFDYARHRGAGSLWRLDPGTALRRSAAVTGAAALALLAAGSPALSAHLGGRPAEVLATLQADRLNEQDAELKDRGYYEDLLHTDQFVFAPWRTRNEPSDWTRPFDSGVYDLHDDILNYTHRPSFDAQVKRAPYRTNRWGLRDREYEREKPEGVLRLAFLGASYEVGAGVENHQTLEAVLEDRLNRAGGPAEGRGGYEVLNFAVGGYSLLHNVAVADRQVFGLAPDVLLLAIHSTEDNRLLLHLEDIVRTPLSHPYPELAEILDRSGAEPEMPARELEGRLRGILDEVNRWSLSRIAAAARAGGARPLAVYIPTTEEAGAADAAERDRVIALAEAAGFGVVSLEGAYGDATTEALELAPWDQHPNAEAHRLLGERLYRELLAEGLPAPGGAGREVASGAGGGS